MADFTCFVGVSLCGSQISVTGLCRGSGFGCVFDIFFCLLFFLERFFEISFVFVV